MLMIMNQYGLEFIDALTWFLYSQTYAMLIDISLEMWNFDMWEAEQVNDDPKKLFILSEIDMDKELKFFLYLLENYEPYKNTSADKVFKK